MAYSYDPESIPKLERAIQQLEEYKEGLPARLAIFEEIAAQSGSKKFEEQITNLKEIATSFAKTLGAFVGEDGDKASEGTLKGCLATMRTLDQVMNG